MDKELAMMNLLKRLIDLVDQVATFSNARHGWIARECDGVKSDWENIANENG